MKLEYNKVEKELKTVRERQLLHTTKPFRIKMTKLVYSGQTNWETKPSLGCLSFLGHTYLDLTIHHLILFNI